jgi:hypothetical protein
MCRMVQKSIFLKPVDVYPETYVLSLQDIPYPSSDEHVSILFFSLTQSNEEFLNEVTCTHFCGQMKAKGSRI